MRIVLASASSTRARILNAAGVRFDTIPAAIDERAAEAPLLEAGAAPDDIALALASIKAKAVSEREPGAIVIGADQTLALDEKRFDKPASQADARRQLLELSGRTHGLHAGVAGARDGAVIWSDVQTAWMTMRPLSPRFVGQYLAEIGRSAMDSVGGYQVEGLGIQLFERIDGDHFTVLGLPILPLLQFLRDVGAIDE